MEIESASSRLQARALTNKEVEDEAFRIHRAATDSRRTLERLDDFFLARLRATIDSAPPASKEPKTPDDVLAANEPAG